jgi:hypothetical protein
LAPLRFFFTPRVIESPPTPLRGCDLWKEQIRNLKRRAKSLGFEIAEITQE